MDRVADVSNADIAWFVVKFEEEAGNRRSRMVLDEVRYTTLERSVEGLTGGTPVPKNEFEKRIAGKLKKAATVSEADLDGLVIQESLPDQI